MRKILLISSVLFSSISVHAQISKGSLFLGGDVSGGTQKTKEGETTINKQSGFQVSPVVGIAIRENLIFGVNATFMFGESKNPPAGKFETDTYALGTFLRKYKAIGTSGFYLFLQGGVNAMADKQVYDNYFGSTYTSKKLTIGVSAYPGLSYAVSRKLHLETGFNNLVSVNYFSEKKDAGSPSVKTRTNGFNVSSSLSNPRSNLFLGFRMLIAK